MRDLKRNQRSVWYAVPVNTVPILDDYGNDTLEVETIYLPPALLRCNVSASVGQEAVEVFGSQTEYNRTITITGLECPLFEGCRVWFTPKSLPNVYVTGDGRFFTTADGTLLTLENQDEVENYEVVRVADSKNGFLVALREVTPHA